MSLPCLRDLRASFRRALSYGLGLVVSVFWLASFQVGMLYKSING